MDSVALVVFPTIDTEAKLWNWLIDLEARDRWRYSMHQTEKHNLHLEWKTEEGKWSSCMGFAPLISMPVPRRLPLIALVLWPGVQSRSVGEVVSFFDIQSGIGEELRADLIDQTNQKVEKLFEIDPDKWRETTFVLPGRLLEHLRDVGGLNFQE